MGAAVQLSVAKAQEELVEVIPEWGLHYNRERPHEARGHLPPGMETPPETIDTVRPNDIVCKTRLGGLLTSYSRRAAWVTLYQIVRFARAVDTQIVEMGS